MTMASEAKLLRRTVVPRRNQSIFQSKDDPETEFRFQSSVNPKKRDEGGREAGRSPFLVFGSENRQTAVVVACPAWESGKPDFGFPLSHPGHARLWECGNLAPLARFPRGCGKRGKAAFAFPRFPWTRHFHSPSRPSVRSPRVR